MRLLVNDALVPFTDSHAHRSKVQNERSVRIWYCAAATRRQIAVGLRAAFQATDPIARRVCVREFEAIAAAERAAIERVAGMLAVVLE